jgi:phosphate transport system protein
MANHYEESLQRDIESIRQQVVEMSALAEHALRDCVRALSENNRQLAYAVILRDQYIDEKEKAIDRMCLEFLVRQQPVAGPLRLVYSTIKIDLELERVGDYAEAIARQVLRLSSAPRPAELPLSAIVELAELAIRMLHDSIESFIRQDPELARKTIPCDAAVDTLQTKISADLVELLRQQKMPIEVVDPLLNVGRRLERVSDQARNICMEVLYMCTGEYAKHPGSETFRVLFVDEHNSCRSQMAEAIAQSLQQPRFHFSSAGIEPRPIDARTVDFMMEKGFDLTRLVPKAICQVPYLDHYQVIVALAPEAQKAFPRSPRKMVYLDWRIPDPSRAQGSAEEISAAFETTYEFIASHVHDLVEAILGSDKARRD